MAVRGWGGSLATAIGVAAGAGAAQLGLGYGLGIIAWLPSADAAGEAAWVASLTWSVWIAATSTVVGAICAARLGGVSRPDPADPGAAATPDLAPAPAPLLWRAALAVAGAIGSLVTVVLVAVPARTVARTDLSPQIAAGYAVVGVMTGLLAAFWAISSPAAARNVLGTLAWLWVLAGAVVVDDVVSGGGPATTQLGVWQLTSEAPRFWFRDHLYWPGALLALGSALVIGALAARAAARQPATRVGAAVSGMAGPLLVAAGYVAVAPRLADIRAEQVSAQLVTAYAVIVGVAGSALVAAFAQRSWTRTQRSTASGRPTPAPVGEIPAAAPPSPTAAPDVEVPSPRRTEDGTTPEQTTPDRAAGRDRAEPSPAGEAGDETAGKPAASPDGGTPSGGVEPASDAAGGPAGDSAAPRSDTAPDSARSTSRRGRVSRRTR
ncbi:hypothetical protein [Micromonospora sp. HM5-17]|jgi:hypothetical protein|uniref:hypothetical protein n=1 Tax=Micromonospora sp. HM5-17 TaxID=2487710 RepID=UPI000F495616|nr:hypothetical protein [Micromonospora sp. HM5-17]ROT33576.1 hypothetical protein EF879_01050 [Micromonospora sp. HM5-17]